MHNRAVDCRRSPRSSRMGMFAFATFVIASWFGSATAAQEPTGAALSLHFIGLKSSQGALMVAVYNSEAAYESSGTASDTAFRSLRLDIKDGAALSILEGLPPGQYAIKAFHDLNSDSKLNLNFFGIPTEPVAFSNDAPVHLHAPSWKETVFVVHAGDNAISIHID